ncbi:MAG: hypothetical protein ABSA05_00725 [Opitutaceae bacterium]|jgi:hypothetical protein
MHIWKFFRTGGIDQVVLESGADLLNLDQLDQKLWVALSCPVKGLELDERTLALVDTDGDGRIGVPEVLAAVKWAGTRLNDAGDLLKGAGALPLPAIQTQTPEGRILLAAARQILAGTGRKDAAEIAVAEADDTAKVFAASPLNGDGIIPVGASEDPAVQAVIQDIIACGGGVARQSGATGVTAEKIGVFFAELAAYVAVSEQKVSKGVAVLGEATGAAYGAIKAVRAKVEDYFARCQLAAFDARAVAALNRSEVEYPPLVAKDLKLSAEELAGFPLAHIEAGKPLPLVDGVNPAWAGALLALRENAVAPIWGAAKSHLTVDEWLALTAKFAAYESAVEGQAGSAVEKIGLARIKEILAGPHRAALEALVAQDKSLAPEFNAISDVQRLVRYYRDLRTLLHNFVNFADFYSVDRYAAFQAGTLYLDNRSTELCLRVDGPNPLAAMSQMYIAYCSCTPAGGGAAITIAACFTQGHGDYLFVGRNGAFYDRKGRLWYALVTSIVDNPISIRQAFWSPYKKFIRYIEQQIAKHAAEEDAEASSRLTSATDAISAADKAKAKPEPKKVDLALITGIGVAIGSIGTFCATVFAKFVDLPSWQLPLILVGLMLIISLPSMLIAALKLRQRTLGPILEGNGWAVNGHVKINIPFGAALTKLAVLPPGAKRSLEDPYEDKEARRRRRRAAVLLFAIVLAAAATWIRWDHNRRGHYFWESAPQAENAAPR